MNSSHSSRQSNPTKFSMPLPSYDRTLQGHGLTDAVYLGSHDSTDVVIEKIGDDAVGHGGHSDVWKGSLTRKGSATLMVALKVLRPLGSDQGCLQRRLGREVRYWKQLDHPNIAPFYGVHIQANGLPAILLPWYKNGSADVYLRWHDSVNPVNIIHDIASGIEYLHCKNIVHGDIKGANVMIDDQGHARLIDFGLARSIDSEDDMTKSTMWSTRWCAPELLCSADTRTTKASDVYAFGSTVLELLTGDVPYVKLPNLAVYWKVIHDINPRRFSAVLRYDIPHCDLFWYLLEQCWSQASQRPPISEVKQSIRLFDP